MRICGWPGPRRFRYQRQVLGDDLWRRLMEQCCHPLCSPQTPGAFYRGHRLMALDGTLFNVPDTAAHDAVRAVMLQAAAAGVDPDRLSFTEAVFQISEAIDDGMVFAPEHRERLARRVRRCLCQKLLPARHLRINRREIKQVYRKYKPKKRGMPPPEPFQAHERFEDCVVIEVRYPLPTSKEGVLLALK